MILGPCLKCIPESGASSYTHCLGAVRLSGMLSRHHGLCEGQVNHGAAQNQLGVMSCAAWLAGWLAGLCLHCHRNQAQRLIPCADCFAPAHVLCHDNEIHAPV